MMTDSNLYMTLAAAGLAAIAMLAYTGLTGWRGWLQLKHEELAARHEAEGDRTLPHASARLEIADLTERIPKPDAVAAGVGLGIHRRAGGDGLVEAGVSGKLDRKNEGEG